MKIIAVEEHFGPRGALTRERETGNANRELAEKGSLDHLDYRLKDMDEAGIDMQVLSCGGSNNATMVKSINDELSEVVKKYPERFAGFATLALQDPDTAADELERAVRKLGLKGAMIFCSEFLDEQKYWVILERAEKLDVPIYFHPERLSPAMATPYSTYPVLAGSAWGFAALTGLHAMRLIFSGVFDKYPRLKIILGHLGEGIPYFLWRIDNRWAKEPEHTGVQEHKLQKKPSQYFKDNFYVSTSGMFWPPVLQFALSVMGADKVLFAVDYPPESARDAAHFIKSVQISESEREKICHLNAEKLFRL